MHFRAPSGCLLLCFSLTLAACNDSHSESKPAAPAKPAPQASAPTPTSTANTPDVPPAVTKSDDAAASELGKKIKALESEIYGMEAQVEIEKQSLIAIQANLDQAKNRQYSSQWELAAGGYSLLLGPTIMLSTDANPKGLAAFVEKKVKARLMERLEKSSLSQEQIRAAVVKLIEEKYGPSFVSRIERKLSRHAIRGQDALTYFAAHLADLPNTGTGKAIAKAIDRANTEAATAVKRDLTPAEQEVAAQFERNVKGATERASKIGKRVRVGGWIATAGLALVAYGICDDGAKTLLFEEKHINELMSEVEKSQMTLSKTVEEIQIQRETISNLREEYKRQTGLEFKDAIDEAIDSVTPPNPYTSPGVHRSL